jgi:hypothetical protein
MCRHVRVVARRIVARASIRVLALMQLTIPQSTESQTVSTVGAAKFVRSIGADGPEAISSVRDAAVSRDGIIYVLDDADKRIRAFSVEGRLLRSFGRSGRGPGEFTLPVRMMVDSSSISVLDRGNGVVRYSLGGRYLGQSRVGGLETSVKMRYAREVSVQMSPLANIDPRAIAHVVVRNGSKVDTVQSYETDAAAWEQQGAPVTIRSTGFGRSAAWSTIGDSIIVLADGRSGLVRWISVEANSLREIRRARLTSRPRLVSNDELDFASRQYRSESFEFSATSGGITKKTLTSGRFVNAPKYWSIASRIIVSTNGDVWINGPSATTNSARQQETLSGFNLWTVLKKNGSIVELGIVADLHVYAVVGDLIIGVSKSGEQPGLAVYRCC